MAGYDRRNFITHGLRISALICAGATARAACVDPDELSDSVQSMRESLEYTDVASDEKTSCKDCYFFKPVKVGDECANCEILSSPVTATGHCASWTERTSS